MRRHFKRPTVKDVAKIARVSTATVSRALADPKSVRTETLNQVREAVRSTGYSPNRTAADLRSGRSKTVLVLVSDIADVVFSEFFKGIEEEARLHGYATLISDISELAEKENGFSDMLLLNQAGGLILNAIGFPKALRPDNVGVGYSGPPIVSCDEQSGISCPIVRMDDATGGRLAAEHLISLGHTNMIQICGPLSSNSFRLRYQGFNNALEAAGIPVQRDHFLVGSLSAAFGLHAAQNILERSTIPTAIFVHNDETAFGLMHGLTELGVRIPKDVSVVGYNDVPTAAVFNPGLTTVRLARRKWGRLACQKLIDILEDKKGVNGNMLIPPEFVRRSSTRRVGEQLFSIGRE